MKSVFINQSNIESVDIYRNAAIVRRSFLAELIEGENEIKLINIENTVIPYSIRVFAAENVRIRNIEFSVVKKPIEEIDIRVKKKLLEDLENLEVRKEILENEINGFKQVIGAIDDSVGRIMISFGKKAVAGKVKEENLSKTLKYLTDVREEKLKQLVEKEKELKKVTTQIERIKSQLTPGDERKLREVGTLTLFASTSTSAKYAFKVEYNVANVSWMPTYDLILQNEEVILAMYAKILQRTNIPWENVPLTVSTKIVQPVSKPEPKPWYIERVKPRPRVKTPTTLRIMEPKVPESLKAEIEAEEKLAFEEGAIVEGEYLTFKIKEPISLYPDKPQLALLTSQRMKAKTKHVWHAFRQPGFIEIVEFENPELSISPGECRIFKGNMFIGVTKLPYVTPGQKVELATTWEETIETKRKLIRREEKGKRLLRDKVYIRYTYKLAVVNRKETPISAEIIDQIPVAKDPEIEVLLERVSAEPVETDMGILKWKFEIKPGEEKEIEYTFIVKFPPDYEIVSLP